MESDRTQTPLVSVIVPVFSVAPYLREALDSLRGQTYKNLEILLVDDGSKDGSGQICDEYAAGDPRIQVLHQENQGPSVARNAGLDRMSGDYVTFLDSDDAYCETFVETLLRAILDHHADVAVCNYGVFHTEDRMEGEGKNSGDPFLAPGLYDRVHALQAMGENRICVVVWNKVYRRELWEGIRFREGHVFEDTEPPLRVFDRCSRVCVLEDKLYRYRKRPGSITKTHSLSYEKDRLMAADFRAAFVADRTPAVFTPDQRTDNYLRQLKAWIAVFFLCSRESGQEWKDFSKIAREKILEIRDQMGKENLPLRRKAVCGMIQVCPWLPKVYYPVYLPIRELIWKLFGK